MNSKLKCLILLMPFIFLAFLSSCARREVETKAPPPVQLAEPVLEESRVMPDESAAEASSLDEEEESTPEADEEKESEIESAAESEVPVIEPKKMEPQEVFVEPTLKILLFGKAQSIRVKSPGELTLNFDSTLLKTKSEQQLQFRLRSSRVGVRKYPVGIATFRSSGYDKAVAFAEKWKHDGYTVRLIKAGGPFTYSDGSATDTTVYWVALGSFKKKDEATRFRDKMNKWGYSAWIIDESVLNPKGNIEIVDESGNVKGYADSHVSVTGEEPIEIDNVPYGLGFWSSGNCENRTYASPLEIFVDEKGNLAVINLVSLEDYVKGIVPVEIRLAAPDEALKAQAIAARTEALAKLGIKHVFDPYDYCASQHCQEFGGFTRRTERTNAAVDATRGMVLMNDGDLVDAVYSANCGGHTENNENVWSGRRQKALRGISDLGGDDHSFDSPIRESQLSRWLRTTPRAYCADPRTGGDKLFRWDLTFKPKELAASVSTYRDVGAIKDVKILKRGISGRVLRLKIVGSRGSFIIYKELEIRYALGKLRSTMFLVDITRNSNGDPVRFRFVGGGWGHGVGMCQAGAEGMALAGFSYDDILKHYFSDVEIKKLYD